MEHSATLASLSSANNTAAPSLAPSPSSVTSSPVSLSSSNGSNGNGHVSDGSIAAMATVPMGAQSLRYSEWGVISWRSSGVASKTRQLRLSQVTELKLGMPTYVQIVRLRAATASLMGRAPTPSPPTPPSVSSSSSSSTSTATSSGTTNNGITRTSVNDTNGNSTTSTATNTSTSVSGSMSNMNENENGLSHEQLLRCFSLVTAARTLDIVAPDDHTYQLWITGLQPLLRHATLSDHRITATATKATVT
jgi:hypothetical protein